MTSSQQLLFTICFAAAILHTLLAPRVRKYSHLLGEVELVFGLWALVALIGLAISEWSAAKIYLAQLSFTEPLFVLVILVVAASRPVLEAAESLITGIARGLARSTGLPTEPAFLFSALTVGPLTGSLITEPAAMTVTALLLRQNLFSPSRSSRFKYSVLGALFVNVSVGGVLTPFAAPPVLMVAQTWGWGLAHMMQNFAWKGVLTCLLSATWVLIFNRRELAAAGAVSVGQASTHTTPFWLIGLHGGVLALVVAFAHHPFLFLLVFAAYLALQWITRRFQDSVRWKEGGLVAIFLAGLVVLGGPQRWWLEGIILKLTGEQLYVSAIALTAILDNAAITYLGSQVGLVEPMRYFIVAGSVVGGGLTVIANAPNPIGYGLLNESFGEGGISALKLFIAALVPTLIAAVLFFL